MMDFLKANPHVTREQYLWNWTIPQIRLASFDSTHIEYTNKKDAKNGGSYKVDKVDSIEKVEALIASGGF